MGEMSFAQKSGALQGRMEQSFHNGHRTSLDNARQSYTENNDPQRASVNEGGLESP